MKRIIQADIDAMRSRGFDSDTIRCAEEAAALSAKADKLCKRVRSVFSGVQLGEGIGLFEGQAIDDYEPADVRCQIRENDEKLCWENIEAEHLNACFSSLSFFDSLGMKFHLPAFIVAELNDEYHHELTFHLTTLDDYNRTKFDLLNPEQRQVIREYLLLLRENPDSEFDVDAIDRSLAKYWT